MIKKNLAWYGLDEIYQDSLKRRYEKTYYQTTFVLVVHKMAASSKLSQEYRSACVTILLSWKTRRINGVGDWGYGVGSRKNTFVGVTRCNY